MPTSRSYQFGPFRLDAAGRVLFRDGHRVALTPRAVDVLIALVEAQGQPVGKDELLKNVWAGVIVEEGSLASHISLLRKALGEDGGNGFIETLPKRGYRFVGPVADVQPAAAPTEERVMLAVAPFETRGGIDQRDDFSEGLTEEVITQLVRLSTPRFGVAALADDPSASHRLDGSIRRMGNKTRITAQLVRTGDTSPSWAESYERNLDDELALQVDVAKAIARETKAKLAPLRTLTFLFTCMESNAVAWDARAATIERHNALLQEAIARYGGRAFRVVDDAFCVAFSNPSSAVLAAVSVQRALRAASWGDTAVNVRIGLHSGTVEEADGDDLSGPTLARTARVMAAAHGGQILLTVATVALLERIAPPGCEWRDLGDHTLRGFVRPERLYQLSADGLRAKFPPIHTQEAMRTNLPPSLTAFIGRQKALADVRDQACRARMVTLVGAGGTGKTRLSLEVARQLVDVFPDGVWLVELAPLTDAMLVARAIVSALGVRAEGDVASLTLIESTLRRKRALLLLDNCEHVIEEAATVAQTLLRTLPQLHVLATSREALGIEGEVVYRVPSLTMPVTTAQITVANVATSEAGRLFVERATAARPAFALTEGNAVAVAQLCRRLDGIPLAIELAAARLASLSVEEVARRIDDRFHLLTGGLRTALPRHRTLRALVDWSYDLLSSTERLVLDKLSVFAGSFSLEAAERICSDDALSGTRVFDTVELLVAKSLLIAETQEGTETRYHLLETIRQYASGKLIESGSADVTRRRHFACFLDMAQSGAKTLDGPLALEWLDRLEAEHDNLRAALDWSADDDPNGYARLAGALRSFWDTRGHYTEAWARLTRALDVHTARDPARLEVLIGAGLCAHRLAYAQRSDDILGEAIALSKDLGDVRGEAEATLWLGWVHQHSRGTDAVERLAQHGLALAKSVGDRRLEALELIELGRIANGRGQRAAAQRLFLESARVFRDAGCVIGIPGASDDAGQCALDQLDFEAARHLLGDALVQYRRVGNVHDAANIQVLLARLAMNEDRLDEARALCAESLGVFHALHDPKCGAKTAIAHATVLHAMGDPVSALSHAESAAATYRELDIPLQMVRALCTIANVHATLDQMDAARLALFSGLVEQQRTDQDNYLPALLETVAWVHANAPVAAQLLGSATALRERWSILVMPFEREERERRLADIRIRYSDRKFSRAFAAGRAMTRDDAIRSALALR